MPKFEKIARMREHELLSYLPKVLLSNRYSSDDIKLTKTYLYAKGNIPVLLVAHLDTVHKTPPQDIFYDARRTTYWSPEGIGADDRAGVYGILQLLDYKPHILFTTGEEVGGIGAWAAAEEMSCPPVNFIIELDRRGKQDAVFYDCNNKQFKQYILEHGFVEAHGIFSDISILCESWDIAGVNLSCGYYNEHSLTEYFNITHLMDTLGKVRTIFENLPNERFSFEPVKYTPNVYNYVKYGYNSIFGAGTSTKVAAGNKKSDRKSKKASKNHLVKCDYCLEKELYSGEFAHFNGGYYCPDCMTLITQVGRYYTCVECNEFKTNQTESRLEGVCQTCFDAAIRGYYPG